VGSVGVRHVLVSPVGAHRLKPAVGAAGCSAARRESVGEERVCRQVESPSAKRESVGVAEH
jgi:hypothetical protein